MVKASTVHTFRVEKCSSTLKTGVVNSSETRLRDVTRYSGEWQYFIYLAENKESRQKYKVVTFLFVCLSLWKAIVKKVDVGTLKTLMRAMTFHNPDDFDCIPRLKCLARTDNACTRSAVMLARVLLCVDIRVYWWAASYKQVKVPNNTTFSPVTNPWAIIC
jgi:hypothetical protein